MSYARSPRPVCSMTMGTNIICGSFTFTCHTPAPKNLACGGGSKWSAFTRTGDTKNRGSFRCGFYFGFYPAHHHVSNELEWLPTFVLTAWPALRPPDRFPGR